MVRFRIEEVRKSMRTLKLRLTAEIQEHTKNLTQAKSQIRTFYNLQLNSDKIIHVKPQFMRSN